MLEDRNEFRHRAGASAPVVPVPPLLRDLLEHTLRRDQPHAHREAHRAAATWLVNHGEPMTALKATAAAGDCALFAEIPAAAAGPSLIGTGNSRLEALLREVPFADPPDGVEVELMRTALAFATGRHDAMHAHLDRAQGAPARRPVPPHAATVALLELLVGTVRWSVGDIEGVTRAFSAVVVGLDAADPFPAAPGYRAIAEINLGLARLWSGTSLAPARPYPHLSTRTGTRDADIVDVVLEGSSSRCWPTWPF